MADQKRLERLQFDENGEMVRDPRFMPGNGQVRPEDLDTPAPEPTPLERARAIQAQRASGKSVPVIHPRQGTLAALKAEAARRAQANFENDPYARDAIPTGDVSIDKEGESFTMGSRNGMLPETTITRPVHNPESPKGRMRDAAKRGIDFRKGMDFAPRFAQATSLPTGESRMLAVTKATQNYGSSLPEGMPLFAWDENLGQVVWSRQITQQDVDDGLEPQSNVGKYRQTSMDETGLSIGDLADMMDPAEAGAMIGAMVSVAGTGKLTFLKSVGKQSMGGLVGKEAGRLVQLAAHMSRGGDAPTFSELSSMFATDAGIETAASFLGESIARAGGRMLGFTKGHGGLDAPTDAVAENIERANARAAMRRTAEATDRQLVVSEGEASGRNSMLEAEKTHLRNAQPEVRQFDELRRIANQEINQDLINRQLRGNPNVQGMRLDAVREIKEAVHEGSKITMMVSKDGRDVKFFPTAATERGAVTLKDRGGEAWQIWHTPDFGLTGLRGVGLGTATYEAMALEARRHGRALWSDTQVTPEALAVWKGIDGKEGIGKLNWNSDGIDVIVPGGKTDGDSLIRNFDSVDAAVKWVKKQDIPSDDVMITSRDGRPLVEMPAVEDGVAKNLLDAEVIRKEVTEEVESTMLDTFGNKLPPVKQTKTEVIDPLDRFRRAPGQTELGAVAKELGQNPHQQAEFLTRLFASYEDAVLTNGFDLKKHKKWLTESARVLNKIVGPDDYSRIYGAPGGFREVVETMNKRSNTMRQATGRVLNKTGEDTAAFLENNDKVYTTMERLFREDKTNPKFRRMMALLRTPGSETQLSYMQDLMKEEVRNMFTKANTVNPTRGAALKLETWLTPDRQKFLAEIMQRPGHRGSGQQYVSDLNTVIQNVHMASRRAGITGTSAEAAPATMMWIRALLFKNVFGRRQRAFTAGRKMMQQKGAKVGLNLISDPEALRSLAAIGRSPIFTDQSIAFLTRYGILEQYGVTDVKDKKQMETFRQQVMADIEEFKLDAKDGDK